MKPTFLLLLCLTGFSSYVSAAELGRLFTSESERRQLDAIRAGARQLDAVSDLDVSTEPDIDMVITPETTVEFSGYIQRHDGQYVVWLNGKSPLSRPGIDSPVRRIDFSSDPETVTLSTRQAKAAIKPGQVWLLEENKIYEGYQPRQAP